MEINNVNFDANEDNLAENNIQNEYVPVKADSMWDRVKAFFMQDVEQDNFWFKKISVGTPKDEDGNKMSGFKGFLFQEITLS